MRKSSYPTWFTRELISLTKAKKTAHCRFKNTNRFSDYLVFSNLRAQYKIITTRCFKKYVQDSEDAISSNVKVFWKFINSMITSDAAPMYIYHTAHVDDNTSMENYFAEYFESV